jgi:hypothetical protein
MYLFVSISVVVQLEFQLTVGDSLFDFILSCGVCYTKSFSYITHGFHLW